MRATRRQRLRPNPVNRAAPLLGALRLEQSIVPEDLPDGAAVSAIRGLRDGSTLEIVGTAEGRFALSGEDLVRGVTALDYETAASHQVTLRETNAAYSHSPRDTVLTIAVQDVPESSVPPADWRMPATVSTDIEGAQASLAEAQNGASAKSRPSLTIAANASGYAEWTVQEAGTLLYSQIVTSEGAATSLSRNGVDQDFVLRGNEGNNRQGMALAVSAGDVIRVTWAANGASRTIHPLLHKIPETGPWDAHLVDGASREEAQVSFEYEAAVLGLFPGRDPIIFNRGQSGASLGSIASGAAAKAAEYAGMVHYVLLGTVMGNNVTTGRPYDESKQAGLLASLDTLRAAYARFVVAMGNTSYRQYPTEPLVTPENQANGSLPYNDNVVHPWMAANLPGIYDASLQRSRIDEYLLTMKDRANLNDGVHSNAAGYDNVRAMWADSWFRWIYTGDWGASQIEQRVAEAEAKAADSSTAALAQAAYNEAGYAMTALAASSGRAALQARLDTAYANLLFKKAGEAVTGAEISQTQSDVDAAQAAVDALEAEEGPTARSADLQARLDAVAVSSAGRTVLIRVGNGGALAGWNSADELADKTSANGPWVADLLDDQGGSTGWSYAHADGPEPSDQSWSGLSSQTAGISAIDWVSDAVTDRTLWNNSGNGARWKFTGLDNGKLYDIDLFARRAGGTGRNVQFVAYGANTVTPVQLDAGNNLSQVASAAGVQPSGGVIEMTANFGNPTNQFSYLTAMRIRERGA